MNLISKSFEDFAKGVEELFCREFHLEDCEFIGCDMEYYNRLKKRQYSTWLVICEVMSNGVTYSGRVDLVDMRIINKTAIKG